MKTNNSKIKLTIFAAAFAAICFAATQSSAFSVLAGWESGGLVNSGPSPFAPTVSGAGLTIVGLTKGSGVTNTTTANVWGGNHWVTSSEAAAIATNDFATFSIGPAANYTVSFNSVDKFYYSHSGTGPASGEFQYSLDGVNFNDVQAISYSASGSVTIDLSSFPDLQNVGHGTNVTFRIVNWGGTSSAGTWYIPNGNTSGNDFEVLGTVTQIPTGQPPTNVVVSPSSVVTNTGGTVSFTVTANGDLPNYFWYQEPAGVTNAITPANLISTTGPTLTLANVSALNSGNYQVVLTNSAGSATSSVVSLTVLDPGFAAQPANITNVLNDVDYFAATVVGTPPIQLLWYYNGNVISNLVVNATTNATTIFTINNPAATNLAGYYLVASNQFGMVTSAVATASIAVTPPIEIARWAFNETNNYTATNPLPFIGTGTAVSVQNPAVSNFIFAAGALFDPNQLVAGAANEAWELNGFPAGIANKTAGFQYNVSTAGYTNILLTWSERHSATASKYMRVQYTTNGTDYVDGDVITFSQVAYQFYSSDLSAKPGVANNTNFAFRVVAEWESTAINDANAAYAGTSSGFGSTGTIREDLMTVWGSALGSNPVPIPLAINLSGTNAILSWSDPSSKFGLQSAPQVTGPYLYLSGAYTNSPYTNAITGAQQFFRLKSN
jgi:hypothetical protein